MLIFNALTKTAGGSVRRAGGRGRAGAARGGARGRRRALTAAQFKKLQGDRVVLELTAEQAKKLPSVKN